jgi:magnesium-transporting ATPase (P-type)
MKKRPIPIIIVSTLFILVGVVGFAYHVKELSGKLYETIWVLFVEILAVTCGILLLCKISWARWLAIAWLLYHVIISAFNSTSEMIAQIVFLAVVSFLLFLPVLSTYFPSKSKHLEKDDGTSP